MSPTLAVEGMTNHKVFEGYVERVLTLTLRPGQVVVMDNLCAHKGHKVRELIEKRRCELLYLPPYSPDFNPSELAWSFIKRLIRQQGPRDEVSRQEAVAASIAALPESFASACFRHCQYLQPI